MRSTPIYYLITNRNTTYVCNEKADTAPDVGDTGIYIPVFLLNLLLGSVHIPFRSVWNILWGNTDESIIWQNIIGNPVCRRH